MRTFHIGCGYARGTEKSWKITICEGRIFHCKIPMGTLRVHLEHLIGALPAKSPEMTPAKNGVRCTSERVRAKSERGLRMSRCQIHMVPLHHRARRRFSKNCSPQPCIKNKMYARITAADEAECSVKLQPFIWRMFHSCILHSSMRCGTNRLYKCFW